MVWLFAGFAGCPCGYAAGYTISASGNIPIAHVGDTGTSTRLEVACGFTHRRPGYFGRGQRSKLDSGDGGKHWHDYTRTPGSVGP
ncbi:MAG: hypothetical protein AB1597_06200 [Chloroflexota bacterium]